MRIDKIAFIDQSTSSTLEIDRSKTNLPASGLEANRVMFVGAAVRYRSREESWAFARDQLPAAYQTLFRPNVRFGNSIVDTPRWI